MEESIEVTPKSGSSYNKTICEHRTSIVSARLHLSPVETQDDDFQHPCPAFSSEAMHKEIHSIDIF